MSLGAVDGAFDLTIDTTTDDGATAGTIGFNNIGTTTALTKLTALTEAQMTFFGNNIKTNGDVKLAANDLFLGAPDDTIDTEQTGAGPGGAVDLGQVNTIRNATPPVTHVLTINTIGTTKGAVTLPGQFVQGFSTAGFDNFNDATFNQVLIRVAVPTNFFEDFTNPNASNRFASNFFTQVGNSFVANPPKKQKAIAIINTCRDRSAAYEQFHDQHHGNANAED